MIVRLSVDIWSCLCSIVLHSLVSTTLSGTQESVMAIGCLVENISETLSDVATEQFTYNVFLLGAKT